MILHTLWIWDQNTSHKYANHRTTSEYILVHFHEKCLAFERLKYYYIGDIFISFCFYVSFFGSFPHLTHSEILCSYMYLIFNGFLIYKMDVSYFISQWTSRKLLSLVPITLQCTSLHTCADISERHLCRNEVTKSENMHILTLLMPVTFTLPPIVYNCDYFFIFANSLHKNGITIIYISLFTSKNKCLFICWLFVVFLWELSVHIFLWNFPLDSFSCLYQLL